MKIGNYNIIKKIGKGGFGEVYIAEKDDTNFALKVCSKSDEESIHRFNREVRLMESVKSENVIEVLDYDFKNTPPFFVMPLCQGALSTKNYNSNVEMLINDVLQICDGLEALHNHPQRIVHRDINPNNILIDNDKLKLSDLGLGKFEERDSTILTPSSIMMGTEGFAPPEFYKIGGTKNATISSDIYQLGKTIYALYTHESPAYIDMDKIPAGLFYIIRKCTNINPSERYANVSDLKTALNNHLKILKGEDNPYTSFDKLLTEMQGKRITKEHVDNLFNILYEFKDDSELFYTKVKALPIDYFSLLNTGDLQIFMDVYNGVVTDLDNNGKLNWSDAENVASQMKKIFNSTIDIDIRTNALRITLFFATTFNRYAAMDIFNSMLKAVKNDDEANSIAIMLSDNIDEYENIVLQKDQATGIHPTIQAIRYNIIKKNGK